MAEGEATRDEIARQEVLLASGPPTGINGTSAALKRAMDISGSLLGLLLCAPAMAATAIVVRLDSSGPIFFIQDRVGKNGKAFRMYKFRTMVENAEEMLDELIDVDALDEPVFKIKNDPRVTNAGRFLRRWSLDELPQLFNVLKGEMSLVGPRPEETRIVRFYNQWHRKRLLAKPGISGPAQVKGRGDLNLEERVRLDIDYINNYSLARDVQILLQTFPAVLRGNGSY